MSKSFVLFEERLIYLPIDIKRLGIMRRTDSFRYFRIIDFRNFRNLGYENIDRDRIFANFPKSEQL